MEKLLTRDEFREGVFQRDGNKCVICGHSAYLDAHHILERRLFQGPREFGGYFLSNGASVCTKHHIKAEETTLSCDEIRAAAGITTIILPEHLYDDQEYDKWGNIMLKNGQRLKGELFNDESVQKILKQGGVLDLFSKYTKYPRTYHLPWSTPSKDDRQHAYNVFGEERVIGTLKLDGENTTMYNDHIHARSLDSGAHETRKWVKGLWGQIGYQLDDNMRICGENLYAVHTMRYDDLKSYFYLFSVWSDQMCLDWEETVFWANYLGLEMVPVFYDGPFDEKLIKAAFEPHKQSHEGYVVRKARAFTYGEFRTSVGKYVRPEFKQAVNNSHGHWISKKVEVNKLAHEQ